jgi:shikimate 5-dehydrogenase
MLDLTFAITALSVLIGLALAVALAAVVAGVAPVVVANRRERLARHESLVGYYGHRMAFGH